MIVSFTSAAIFIAVGIFVIINSWSLADSVSPIAGGRTTTGTVVDYLTGSNCGKYGCTAWWRPTIQFTTSSGETVSFTGPEDQNPEQDGESVSVSYDPSNPVDAHDISADVGIPTSGILIGALLILFAGLQVVFGHRRVARAHSLHAAYVAASTNPDPTQPGTTSDPPQSAGLSGPGTWVGHRYLHSRTSFVISSVVFLGLLTTLIFIV